MPTGPIAITHGTVTGDVTDASALVWARASAAGVMQVEFGRGTSAGPGTGRRQTGELRLDAGSDFIGRFQLDGLDPDSSYWYRVIAQQGGEQAESALATFRTAPAADRSATGAVHLGGDVGQGTANRPPFPVFAAMAAEAPDFYIFNGDHKRRNARCSPRSNP